VVVCNFPAVTCVDVVCTRWIDPVHITLLSFSTGNVDFVISL